MDENGHKKSRNLKSTAIKKDLMIEALEKSLGVVTTALKYCEDKGVHIARSTFYDLWMKKDKVFKSRVESIEGIALDFAESQLHKNIRDGNVVATIFYLKTKGKKRGYVERQEYEDINPHDDELIIRIIDGNNKEIIDGDFDNQNV